MAEAWRAAARWLADTVTHPGSRWHPAVAGTPRHLFVPAWWVRGAAGWEVGAGAQAAYADRSLVTRVGPLHADHAAAGDSPAGLPTSSSTLPSLLDRKSVV